jgi:Ser/Thr protein kinase RdoA (MazF antagonist)
VVARRGRHWQLEPWQPGRADFHRDPSDARLRNAGAELARLHVASERYEATPAGAPWFQSGTGTAPAVRERLEGLRRFVQRPAVRAAPGVAHGTPEQAVLAGRLSRQLPARAEWAIRELAPLADVSFRLHPCLRDVWHDHVLFRGDDVTGVIDPSAARTENVASDLSRLLGSLVGDEFARWETALDTYSSVRPLSGDERRLVRALDLSGVVLSAVHWLDCMSEAALSDREIKRAAALAERVARCGPGGERAEL